jgi:hypothetical protein
MVNKYLPARAAWSYRRIGYRKELGMASPRPRRPVLNSDPKELEAQRVACSYLVKGCERALFDFGLIAGETGGVESMRIDERAAQIMRNILGSWRDTLSVLAEPGAETESHRAPRTAGL